MTRMTQARLEHAPDGDCDQQDGDGAPVDHGGTPQSRSELLDLVSQTIATFSARGIEAHDMGPLFRLQDALEGFAPPSPDTPAGQEGERFATETLLGRACAVVDLVIIAGNAPEKAAQTVARQLSARNIRFPDDGGDVRAWKRLLKFRMNLVHGSKTQLTEAREAYQGFKNTLSEVPVDHRVQFALDEYIQDDHQL